MPIHAWSETILIAELNDEPLYSDDMSVLMQKVRATDPAPDVIVNLKAVTYINSSNIAQLLKLRKTLQDAGGRLRLCAVADSVWTVLLMTSLDQVFEFTDDVTTSLASLQIGDEDEGDR